MPNWGSRFCIKRSLTPEHRFQSLQVTPGLQRSPECKALELPLSGLILALSGSSCVTYSKLPDLSVLGCLISERRITVISSLRVCYEAWNNKYMQSAYDRVWPKMKVKLELALIIGTYWNFPGGPVAKTPCFQGRGRGLVPSQGTRFHMPQLRVHSCNEDRRAHVPQLMPHSQINKLKTNKKNHAEFLF